MKCPVCLTPDLVMTDRQGIEIDYCPQCRGVWLDRGELDKIIDRSAPAAGAAPPPPPQGSGYPPQSGGYAQQPGYAQRPQYPGKERGKYDDDYRDGYGHAHGHHKKKRGGFLGEIFDFD